MARIDLYRNVHKGQRAHLFALASALGSVDPAEPAAMAELAVRLRMMIADLRQHAATEETFIHPLLEARAPEIAAALEREHRQVDTALDQVEREIGRLETGGDAFTVSTELYRVWCMMVSAYLSHLDQEERVAMVALWRSCTDEEIFAVIRAFVASRSADDLLEDVRSQVPALTPQERAAYVGAVIRGGAVPAERVWGSLSTILPPPVLSRLRLDLGAAAAR